MNATQTENLDFDFYRIKPFENYQLVSKPAHLLGDAWIMPPREVHVADRTAYETLQQAIQHRSNSGALNRIMANVYEEYKNIVESKVLTQAPNNLEEVIKRLKSAFPHFASFITEVEGCCYRACLRRSRELSGFKILIVGQPGIGKTHVVQEVIKALGLHYYRISMNGQTAAFELSGLGQHWAATAPGAIAKCFSSSPSANPLIVLDEIDKGSSIANQYGRSLDTLLDLTESLTAKSFKDNCLQIEIDTSHALYVATANDIDCLPEALVSRFQVLHVDEPTPDEMTAIIQSIYRGLIAEHEGLYSPTLSDELIDGLRPQTPRAIKLRINSAVNAAAARALEAGTAGITPIQVLPCDLNGKLVVKRQSFGFIPSPRSTAFVRRSR